LCISEKEGGYMRKYLIFLLILIIFSSLLISCRQTEPLAPEEPIATLISPSNGETVASGDIQVRIYLQNFSMTSPAGQPNRANEGHAVYYLDVSPPLKPGEPATTASGTCVVSDASSYTWTNVPPGQHTFSVQLVNNDNTPFLSPAAVRATVTVK
jgi:hypothetical protein